MMVFSPNKKKLNNQLNFILETLYHIQNKYNANLMIENLNSFNQ